MSDSLEALAKQYGIPMEVEINDDTRQKDCDAHMATLVSIEGKQAIYEGECTVGHHYEFVHELTEAQQAIQIVNGELSLGADKGYEATNLQEY